ncbi:MAG: GNAT family N-acetyltransferase [Halobacteriovoraceae bacterium]|jgi:RimJ/RimL family protein N-acetyltransferase|nr:GNAT family N-acetyltransferase [Halobacteriovoraceae bacterium]
MIIEFRSLDLESFSRIWDSGHNDNYQDSWPQKLEKTPTLEWQPVYDRWQIVMQEILHNNMPIGYIGLSPKSDKTAHLGYGIYNEFRGKGLCRKACSLYLEKQIPLLSKEIKYLMGTTLPENKRSQKVLKRLGLDFYKKVVESHNNQNINYLQFRKKLR